MSHRQYAQFRAVSGDNHGLGTTPQDALNALTAQLPANFGAPIVILPFNRGDMFFSQAQQDRLQELNARQNTLTDAEHAELDALIETSFDAQIRRMQATQAVKV